MSARLACTVACAVLSPLVAFAQNQRPYPFTPLSDQTTALVHVSVIPMDREIVLDDQTVIIKDGKIADVGPFASTEVPAGAVSVDATGKFLMPGLADMHVHLLDDSDFTLLLANGVTTICNMAGAPMHLEWREKLLAGDMLGPMLYTAGPMLESRTDALLNLAYGVTTVEQAEELVKEVKEEGYDFVKIHGEPTKRVFDAVIEAANRADVRVIGHSGEKYGMEHTLSSGQCDIEHAEEFIYCYFRRDLDESRIPALVKLTKESGVVVTPTLITFKNIPETIENISRMMRMPELRTYAKWKQENWGPGRNQYLRNFSPEQVPWLKDAYEFQKKMVLAFDQADVPLMTGTDYGGPAFLFPGSDVHRELAALVDAGLSPYRALRASTINPANHLGSTAGVIAAGRQADLVLVDANPLEDIANAKKISGVVVRGRWLPGDQLDQMMKDYRARLRSEQSFLTVLDRRGVDAARKKYDAAIASKPEGFSCSWQALVWRGIQAIRSGDMEKTTAIFELITHMYPDHYIGFDLLGKAYAQLGRNDLAKQHLERSLKLNKHNRAAKRLLERAGNRR